MKILDFLYFYHSGLTLMVFEIFVYFITNSLVSFCWNKYIAVQFLETVHFIV